MTGAGGAAAAGAAAQAVIVQAIKASGAIIKLEPDQFQSILDRHYEPLVVVAESGLFSKKLNYLTSYKGLIFYTKTPLQLHLPQGCEVIEAGKIWIPQ